MSTNVILSLVQLELFEQLDEAGRQEVARRLRAYLEDQPAVLARLRAVLTPTLAAWETSAERTSE